MVLFLLAEVDSVGEEANDVDNERLDDAASDVPPVNESEDVKFVGTV